MTDLEYARDLIGRVKKGDDCYAEAIGFLVTSGDDILTALASHAAVRDKALRDAMIKIAELPGPTPDTVPPDQLKKVDKFGALQVGHSMGIMDACTWLDRALKGAPTT